MHFRALISFKDLIFYFYKQKHSKECILFNFQLVKQFMSNCPNYIQPNLKNYSCNLDCNVTQNLYTYIQIGPVCISIRSEKFATMLKYSYIVWSHFCCILIYVCIPVMNVLQLKYILIQFSSIIKSGTMGITHYRYGFLHYFRTNL